MSKKIIIIMITIIIILSAVFYNYNKKINPISRTEYPFTTYVTITLYDTNNEKILDDAFNLVSYYDNLFSRTKITSDVYKLNTCKGKMVTVEDDTIELLKKAIYYGDISNGDFDISVGSVSYLWDFLSNRHTVPDNDLITEGLKHIDYKKIKIKGNNVLLQDENMIIDLGGISKGFIADKVKDLLVEKGVKSAIIDIGGNIFALGNKDSNKTMWKVGIQTPFKDRTEIIGFVSVANKSIVTSGLYERYFYNNDKLYHHILDTKTGYSVNTDIQSVTIISNTSTDGDALSTVVFSKGLNKGIEFIESLENVDAIFITNNGDVVSTSGIGKSIPFELSK